MNVASSMGLCYHHCRSIDGVVYGIVKGDPLYVDVDFKGAYDWLHTQIGFFPLFLSVGTTEDDLHMTGYQNQWRRRIVSGPNGNTYRKPGEFPNDALFSFDHVDGVYMDFNMWHLVLNAGMRSYEMTDYERRLIFKPSWSESRWIAKSRAQPHSVQLVTSSLDLTGAESVSVRNMSAKRRLEKKGFEYVYTYRLMVNNGM